jgi:alpha-glucosidase
MQWDASENAGFSNVAPWLPLADDFARENVRNLDADPASILNLYRALIGLRKQHQGLISGSYQPVAAKEDLLIYRRAGESDSILVVLNFGADPVELVSGQIGLEGELLLSTVMDRAGERIAGSLDLRGNEGVMILTSRAG